MKSRFSNFHKQVNHETGSDSEVGESWAGDYTGAIYSDNTGHELYVFKGYGVNEARYNGADVEPIPITPVHGQNWPGMQLQLKNGWGALSFGRKLSYDDYLRLLTDSATKNRNYLIPHPAGIGPAAVNPGPAPGNVNAMIAASSGAQPSTPGGPGFVAANVNLSRRGYYG
jgi:hypothetical protein